MALGVGHGYRCYLYLMFLLAYRFLVGACKSGCFRKTLRGQNPSSTPLLAVPRMEVRVM